MLSFTGDIWCQLGGLVRKTAHLVLIYSKTSINEDGRSETSRHDNDTRYKRSTDLEKDLKATHLPLQKLPTQGIFRHNKT